MQRRSLLSILLFLTIAASSAASGRISRQDYIAQHRDDAISDMKRTGVPASITLAQALLESDDGNSALATEANNHFGIKCAGWSGATFTQDDDRNDECFRKYRDVLQSYDDHSDFLRTRDRYAFLFKLDITDYEGWAKGLKKAGYATNPQYADRLIKIIEDNRLYEFDRGIVPVASSVSAPVAALPQDKKSKRKFVSPSVTEVDIFASRKILVNNGVEYVIAKKGDTYQSLAKELELGYWQLPKYNETDDEASLSEGQIIYIKPKRNETSGSFYVVKDGDSVHSISQAFGVKSKYIFKWNGLSKDQDVRAGQKIWLQKHKG